jgi:osmotically inducible lipoprotein OsmB
MRKRLQIGMVIISISALVGCSNLPGSAGQQGAVIGGASGAAVGAAVSKNRALGAVIGGAVGAAGGYVVGANKDKILGKDHEGASEAARKSQDAPATADQARTATSADINNDGFVTLDEVVALKQANLTDSQIIEKLRATQQVFELTEEQKRYLLDHGVSRNVVDQMLTLNQDRRNELLAPSDPVVGRPAGTP